MNLLSATDSEQANELAHVLPVLNQRPSCAHTSLAKSWQSQGKRQEVYDLFAPVYHWFPKGWIRRI